METPQRLALSKCSLYIKKNVTNLGEVLDILLQHGCLTWDERNRIGKEKSSDEQCQSLLDIIIRRGGNCYHVLLQSMSSSGNNHIAEEIKNTLENGADEWKLQTMEENISEKNNTINELISRVSKLEKDLALKSDKVQEAREEQIKALEDLRKLKDDSGQRETEIRGLKIRNEELERVIQKLNFRIDYLTKELELKDMSIKRSEADRRRIEIEHTKALENMEKKTEETRMICVEMSDDIRALTKAVRSLQSCGKKQNGENAQNLPRNSNIKRENSTFSIKREPRYSTGKMSIYSVNVVNR